MLRIGAKKLPVTKAGRHTHQVCRPFSVSAPTATDLRHLRQNPPALPATDVAARGR